MDNKQIYKKTLTFSLHRVLWDILAFLLMAGLSIGGFVLTEKLADEGLIGLAVGAIVGVIAVVLILRYVSYTYKAGQIAMMTRAITQGSLPDDVLAEGKKVVHERFATVAIFFGVTGVIKGIFQQLGRVITSVGNSIGGENGNTVGSVISAAIQTLVNYLCDCCLGWVFFRESVNAAKATCEGAVLFFKHGKTLAKNMGRIFGMGIISFVIIGGIFTGILYAAEQPFSSMFVTLSAEIADTAASAESEIPEILSDPGMLMLITALLGAVILWNILHSVFVRPFVLTGVLRNYLESGMDEVPSESSFALLDSKSNKFKKLHSELA